jgi:hypothetical protein
MIQRVLRTKNDSTRNKRRILKLSRNSSADSRLLIGKIVSGKIKNKENKKY